jgi:hypothetical protein
LLFQILKCFQEKIKFKKLIENPDQKEPQPPTTKKKNEINVEEILKEGKSTLERRMINDGFRNEE